MRCDHCPIPDPGLTCPSADHPRYCELARDRPEYRRVITAKAGTTPVTPVAPVAPSPTASAPPLPRGTLVVRGHADSSTGYGRLIGHLIRGLEALGVPTRLDPVSLDESRVPLDPFLKSRLTGGRHDGPGLVVDSLPDRSGSVVFTMWESSRLPACRIEALDRSRVVVVPCRWNEQVYRESGVTAPIRVVPLGVDRSAYYPDGPEPEDFTVLSVARMAHGGARKGIDELISAFLEALGDRPDARLHLKLWPDCKVRDPDHPRVLLDRGSYDDAGMRRLYASCSVYASMTKGEGWGMPVHEAMACGRPYVGPIHTGLLDFVTSGCAYPVGWDPEPGGGIHYTGHGEWYAPWHDSMVRQLRAAYDDPEGSRRKSEAACRRAGEFPWSRTARELMGVLREFGLAGPQAPPTPGLERALRLAMLRRDCPHASKAPGCGCSGEVICDLGKGRAGLASRQDCYACLETRPGLESRAD